LHQKLLVVVEVVVTEVVLAEVVVVGVVIDAVVLAIVEMVKQMKLYMQLKTKNKMVKS
jgi:hypothetical protein